jgi:hypothetical protein
MVTTQSNTPPAYWDQTPIYHYAGPQPSPLYSDMPDASERVLESAASPSTSPLDQTDTIEPDFVYKSDHMEANAGPRVWGLRNPAYGLQGHIEGFVKFLGDRAHVMTVGASVRSPSSTGRICCPDPIAPSSCAETLSSGAVTSANWLDKNQFVFFDNRPRYTRPVVGLSLQHHGTGNIASPLHFPHI